MKTPHTITLLSGDTSAPVYDPITDTYKQPKRVEHEMDCLVNKVTQERVYEIFGNHKDEVIIVRFNQQPPDFNEAIFEGGTYHPIEAIDAPVKSAIRLKRM